MEDSQIKQELDAVKHKASSANQQLAREAHPLREMFIARTAGGGLTFQEQTYHTNQFLDFTGGRRSNGTDSAKLIELDTDTQFAVLQVRDGEFYRNVKIPIGGGGTGMTIHYGVTRGPLYEGEDSVWDGTNTITLTPCNAFDDNTPTGAADVLCYIYSPQNDSIYSADFPPNRIYAYLLMDDGNGLLLPIDWGMKVSLTSPSAADYLSIRRMIFDSTQFTLTQPNKYEILVGLTGSGGGGTGTITITADETWINWNTATSTLSHINVQIGSTSVGTLHTNAPITLGTNTNTATTGLQVNTFELLTRVDTNGHIIIGPSSSPDLTFFVPQNLDDLADVVITDPQPDEVLLWDGSSWINSGIANGIPPGGEKYQVLQKDSSADYDVIWDWVRGHA